MRDPFKYTWSRPAAAKPMRGDRWIACVLAIGAAFWGSLWWVLR